MLIQIFHKIFPRKKPFYLKVAFVISRLSDPVIWVIPLGVMMIYYSEHTPHKYWFLTIGFIIFLFLLPVIIFLAKLKRKKISDIDLTKKEERTPVYVALVVIWGTALFLMNFLEVPQLIFVSLLAAEIICILVLFINLKWKVSNHSLVMTIVSIFFVLIVSPKAWWFFLTIPFVGWSRVAQQKHTPGQIVGGVLLGFIFYIILKNFGY